MPYNLKTLFLSFENKIKTHKNTLIQYLEEKKISKASP